MTQRSSWILSEAGTTVDLSSHMLFVQWARKAPEGADVEDQEADPLPQDKAAVRVVSTLDPTMLRDGVEPANKTKSVIWAKSTCWDVTNPLLELKLTPPPPQWWSENVGTS